METRNMESMDNRCNLDWDEEPDADEIEIRQSFQFLIDNFQQLQALPIPPISFENSNAIRTPQKLVSVDENFFFVYDRRHSKIQRSDTPWLTPKKIPAEVRILEIAEDGTLVLQFRDPKSLETLDFVQRKMKEILSLSKGDIQVKGKDIVPGLLVICRKDDESLFRGTITSFTAETIRVYGVDNNERMELPYQNVYYLPPSVLCSFQAVKCHLLGMRELENTELFKRTRVLLLHAMKKSVYGIQNAGNEDDSIFEYDFLITTLVRLGPDQEIHVGINLPKETGMDVCLNTLIMRHLMPLAKNSFK